MDWLELLEQIFQVCIIPLLGVLTAFAVNFIRAKTKDISAQTDNELYQKYMGMFSETLIRCVLATQQTYVDSLKEQGKFDVTAQKAAFEMTKNAVMAVLTEDAKEYLSSIVGDLNTYISNAIEAQIITNKKTETAKKEIKKV